MALNELKKIESIKEEVPVSDFPYTDYSTAMESLGDILPNDGGQSEFEYRGKIIRVRGIPEDFKVKLVEEVGETLICEIVYGNMVNYNKELVKFLID